MTAAVSVPASRSAPTRSLLAAGAVGGPLFVVAVLAQAYTRNGFDPGRHPLSSLALGELGWLQITNFIGYGVLTLAGAAGMRRALTSGRASTWGPRLIGVGGVALILAGIFPADPINGYPAGMPDAATWHGAVHSLAPAVAGIAGLIAYVAFARRFAAEHDRVWLMWTVTAPVVILVTNAVSAATGDLRALLLGQAVGAAWATSFYLKLRARTSAS